MANYPRSVLVYDGAVFHIMWQCHNHSFLLKSPIAKNLYYTFLCRYKARYRVKIFSYCLMGNHIHLTGQCETQKLLSDYFRTVNSCFSKHLNRQLQRKGQTVMDRFKSPVIQTDDDLMRVMIYNDLNPSRTKSKIKPQDFKWSSFQHYAYGAPDELLDEPACYLELGKTPKERQKNYREMIFDILKDDPRSKDCPYREPNNKRLICYVGDPQWVKDNFEKLKSAQRENRTRWKERFEKSFGERPPGFL